MFYYQAKANIEKNVLLLKFSGFAKTEEIKKGIPEVLNEAAKLSKGFDIINDISNFNPTAKKDVELIKVLQINLKTMGLNRTVRIVNQAIIANMQLKQTSKETGYSALIAKNTEDAYKILGKN